MPTEWVFLSHKRKKKKIGTLYNLVHKFSNDLASTLACCFLLDILYDVSVGPEWIWQTLTCQSKNKFVQSVYFATCRLVPNCSWSSTSLELGPFGHLYL
ncbi:hypothetical protein L6452_10880 [Arctium lappa]|uniref:Uncharacterized protein n=1 Tax=Arctium lappa TaxID=4217 RepID=A0ACB9DNC5_ARCLA|nr:hypothetical protein L6452_10880 [Arctium lappa]